MLRITNKALDRSRVGCRFLNGQSIHAATVNAVVLPNTFVRISQDERKKLCVMAINTRDNKAFSTGQNPLELSLTVRGVPTARLVIIKAEL